MLPKTLDDLAAGLRFILGHREEFGIIGDEYAAAGFSAGGNLTALWGAEARGYGAYHLPKPKALFEIYPLLSPGLMYAGTDERVMEVMFGRGKDSEELRRVFDPVRLIDEMYPPCFLMHCIDDNVVPVMNTVLYERILRQHGIKAEMELHRCGGHGFGDGENTDAAGWPERAIAFLEEIE